MGHYIELNKYFSHEAGLKYLEQAETLTSDKLQNLKEGLASSSKISNSDCDFVFFGSLARNECTIGSDIDWTFLVDGMANPKHIDTTGDISKLLKKTVGLEQPGASGMFGQITFSHDLIHYIGGEDDTNHNISRRILMLLESDYHSEVSTGDAYKRVLRGIINAYLDNDSGFIRNGYKDKLPRFLLNDIIRFWRTVCVDFAYKQKAQYGEKWAIRNIKLGLSRKLIYLKGLLMCYACLALESKDSMFESLYNHAQSKPLDVMIEVFENNDVEKNQIYELLKAYDNFIGILSNDGKRKSLSELKMIDADSDYVYQEAKTISKDFQNKLQNILLENQKLKNFIINYTII